MSSARTGRRSDVKGREPACSGVFSSRVWCPEVEGMCAFAGLTQPRPPRTNLDPLPPSFFSPEALSDHIPPIPRGSFKTEETSGERELPSVKRPLSRLASSLHHHQHAISPPSK